MTTTYAKLWNATNRLRNDPKAWVAAYLELQAEIEAEARQCLEVHLEEHLDAFDRHLRTAE